MTPLKLVYLMAVGSAISASLADAQSTTTTKAPSTTTASAPSTTPASPFVTSVPLDELLGNGTIYDGEEGEWGWGPEDNIPIVQSSRTDPLTPEDLKNVTMIATGYKEAFLLYKSVFAKTYDTNLEEQKRYRNFLLNMANAFYNQTENPYAQYGANNFSDFTPLEFLPYHNLTDSYDRFTNRSSSRATKAPAATGADGTDILQNPFEQDFALYDNHGEFASRGNGKRLWETDTPELLQVTRSPATTRETITVSPTGGAGAVNGSKRLFQSKAESSTASIPTSLDWRKYGAVSPVEAQGYCGGCWAFATAGNIEGVWRIAGYGLVPLSQQNLISCDIYSGNIGCSGGVMQYAYNYIIKYQDGYLGRKDEYPYKSFAGAAPWCDSGLMVPGARIDSYVIISANEDVMMDYVANVGPIAVAVDSTSWQSYIGGIITNAIGIKVDHAVLIVGYDNSYKPPYWIVKNTWGDKWGEKGYLRIAKGTNQCLITRNPTTAFASLNANLPTSPSYLNDGSETKPSGALGHSTAVAAAAVGFMVAALAFL